MIDNLLVMGLLNDKDLHQLLCLIDPVSFDESFNRGNASTCVHSYICVFFWEQNRKTGKDCAMEGNVLQPKTNKQKQNERRCINVYIMFTSEQSENGATDVHNDDQNNVDEGTISYFHLEFASPQTIQCNLD